MVEILCDAIKTRHILRFNYNNKSRLVEPHLVGETSRGQVVLFGWCSEETNIVEPGWRLFVVRKISQLQMLPETFPHPRPHYNPATDKNLSKVLCALPQIFRAL